MKNFSMIDSSSSSLTFWSASLTSSRRSSYALWLYQAYEEALKHGIEFADFAGGDGYLCPAGIDPGRQANG
ncbi:hypothetical protein [cf. Phormidesmis sp. LEGE 11477]|uniref:hypothetical protein n=1 Tax=cf. Phormidesmis sp. LEGE 11477 TaxID=1828680 RepID=UPI001881F0C2|nr:hypothetical protein [cf. Phormidesmis sp. LEGE 11477]MBE9060870.1 hypothetical protein [cf. Phormidesmis sp. LEGE 11477]